MRSHFLQLKIFFFVFLLNMVKEKVVFFCKECGYETPKWLGQCPVCKQWNTFKEEKVISTSQKKSISTNKENKPRKILDVQPGQVKRIVTTDLELNRVLGGGIVPGTLILVGGQPGIGKSTLLLQVALSLTNRILYISGEESEEQISLRASRIETNNPDCYVYTETNLDKILKEAKAIKAQLLIIDSIQTIFQPHIENVQGSITQIRECTYQLQKFAKENHIPIFIVGHITKDGALAGPKILEHIVDVVLQFEGDQHYSYRLLRTTKNRYGSTDELGIYAMHAHGLRQVENPSELLISQNEEALSGSAICVSIEGQRPLLIEAQGLVSPSIYGNPQRSSTGLDLRRLSMLLAVLEKRCGLPFGQHDVFLNIAGGLKSSDPSIDLGVVASLISSFQNIPIDDRVCFAAEVGLSGEIRAVSRVESRIQEADRLGFEKIFISKYNTLSVKEKNLQIRIEKIGKVDDLLISLFEEY
jgi:DNA repair protein RadA/Sms